MKKTALALLITLTVTPLNVVFHNLTNNKLFELCEFQRDVSGGMFCVKYDGKACSITHTDSEPFLIVDNERKNAPFASLLTYALVNNENIAHFVLQYIVEEEDCKNYTNHPNDEKKVNIANFYCFSKELNSDHITISTCDKNANPLALMATIPNTDIPDECKAAISKETQQMLQQKHHNMYSLFSPLQDKIKPQKQFLSKWQDNETSLDMIILQARQTRQQCLIVKDCFLSVFAVSLIIHYIFTCFVSQIHPYYFI
jgi:hypothetical protein